MEIFSFFRVLFIITYTCEIACMCILSVIVQFVSIYFAVCCYLTNDDAVGRVLLVS